MRKYSHIKHFKAVATCTVALMAALLFVTVQHAQADSFTIDPTTPSNPATTTRQDLDDGDSTDEDGEVGLIKKGGELSTTNAHAVVMQRGYNRMTNNGTITISTTGGSYGIFSFLSNYDNITNNGTISTTGSIWAHGIASVFSDNGTISTAGHGIFLNFSNNANFTNNGTITAAGMGILSFACDNGNINNNGVISVTVLNTIGIEVGTKDSAIDSGKTNTINNSGLISATKDAEYAI